jgi:lysophospholipase L1-like esterase
MGYEETEILLMGSSSIQKWKTSGSDLGPAISVNVGVSGSVIGDWYRHCDTLVVPFNPKTLVIYIGSNDLHNDKKDPAVVMQDLEVLFNQLHDALPNTKMYYVSVFKTGAFPELWSNDEQFNTLVKSYTDTIGYLEFIDCDSALSSKNVNNNIYEGDLVHLNSSGYIIWTSVIRQALALD